MEDETIVPDNEDKELEAIIDEEVDEEATADELKVKLAKRDELLKEAIKTKKNWRTKYEELSSKMPKPDTSSTTTPTVKPEDELKEQVQRLTIAEEKRQFGYTNGLSPEETDKAFAYAKGLDIKPDEALKDNFFQKALDAHRAEQRQSSATPHSSHKVSKVEGKTFEEMKPEERQKNWAKLTARS